METIYLYTDGGSRGNPGPAAIGVILKNPTGEILEQKGALIGRATNNEAEYQALIEGLKLAQKFSPRNLLCQLDSSLVVNQLNGQFKIKEAHLQRLVFEIQRAVAKLPQTKVEFKYIPREENKEADKLLNQTLDRSH